MEDKDKSEVAAAETKAEAPQSLNDRMLKSASEAWHSVATESAAETTETTEAEKAAETTETTEVEAKADETKEAPVELPWTAEQMRDPKFYDRLDKKGWELLEQYSPAMAEKARAVASALGKATSPKYKAQQAQTEERTDTSAKQPSPELANAFRKMQSLDQTEALEGFREMQDLTLGDALPKFGVDPAQNRAVHVAVSALRLAVAALPEIANLDPNKLDAAVDADPALTEMLTIAADLPDDKRVALTATVMRKAGEAVIATQKAASDAANAEKTAKEKVKAETQRKVRSNANIASNVVVESPASGAPAKKKSMEERAAEMWSAEAANG